MQDKKYTTYSARKSSFSTTNFNTELTTGLSLGVNEMTETGMSMGLNGGKAYVIDGITSDMDDGIMKELLQDGLSSALSLWSGTMMQKQDVLLESVFNRGAGVVTGYVLSSKALGFMKGLKGRKAGFFSKFLGSSEEAKATNARLIADFAKMDVDSSANSYNPSSRYTQMNSKLQFEGLQVQKEGVNSRLAKIQIDGLRDTFEMKMKTSSFKSEDKALIRKMTGMNTVTDKEIKKLNALSSNMVFQDSEGNWIGGNEAQVAMLNSINFNRAN